jgi:TorA maturation chaperone TorD
MHIMKSESSPETDALDRATIYDLLAAGFRRPLGAFLRTLRDPAFLTRCLLATSRISDDVARVFIEARNRLLAGCDGDLAVTHACVFSHEAKCDWAACGGDYLSADDTTDGDGLAGITDFYAAFGLRVADHLDERVDHAGVECEFMGYLCALEAAAHAQAKHEAVDVYRFSQRAFLEGHLGRFLPSFSAHVRRHAAARGHFLEALAVLASTFIAVEALRLGAAIAPEAVPLRLVRADEDDSSRGSDPRVRSARGSSGKAGA